VTQETGEDEGGECLWGQQGMCGFGDKGGGCRRDRGDKGGMHPFGGARWVCVALGTRE